MLALIRIPGVVMSGISIAATSTSIGFLSATLEPHLRQVSEQRGTGAALEEKETVLIK